MNSDDIINNKIDKYKIVIPIIIFFIISILSIYGAGTNILTKQILWYIVGFLIILFSSKFKCKNVIDIAYILYILGNLLLFLLLIFGNEINGSKCWFIIPGIGSFQPSEFMKIILIITNAKILTDYKKSHPKTTFKDDLKIFIIIMLITSVPSVLTFLEPDTGMVIIYFFISFVMLFIYGIKKSIFIMIISILIIVIGSFLFYYFNYQDAFINLFGTSFFYRIDRLTNWSSNSGMQITNALAAIKSAGLFGFGIGNTPIYIPEAHTDFIFSVFANNTGLLGTIILLITIIIFDFNLYKISEHTKDSLYKLIIVGFLAMIIYQQIQNIGMNIGLLP